MEVGAVTGLDLEEVLHGRARLSVLAFLLSTGASDFSLIREHTGMTDGNLSVHLRKLEDAGYVTISKAFVGRRPRTTASLTEKGRAAFDAYLDQLQRIIDAARTSESATKGQGE